MKTTQITWLYIQYIGDGAPYVMIERTIAKCPVRTKYTKHLNVRLPILRSLVAACGNISTLFFPNPYGLSWFRR